MKKQSSLWMKGTLYDCCGAYYGWKDGFDSCLASAGGAAPTSSPIQETWCKYSRVRVAGLLFQKSQVTFSLRRRRLDPLQVREIL